MCKPRFADIQPNRAGTTSRAAPSSGVSVVVINRGSCCSLHVPDFRYLSPKVGARSSCGHKCDSKPLTEPLNPSDATLTKNPGGCPPSTYHSLHVCSVDIHRDGPLDQLKRYHHAQTGLFAPQYALKAGERTASNADATADGQERMRPHLQTLRKPRSHDFHFRIRQRSWQSAKPDKAHHARNLHNAQPLAQRQP